MARQTAAEIYADLKAAGYSPAAAVLQTAIALATSGGQLDAAIETGQGPAYGVYGIRVDPGATGTGSPRDVALLAQGGRAQASAAYDLSTGGTNFGAWAAFRDGSYQDYVGQAQTAAAGVAGADPGQLAPAPGAPATPAAAGPGPDWLPWNWGDAAEQGKTQVRTLALTGAAVGLGLLLVLLGGGAAVMPRVRSGVRQVAQTAAKVV